MSQKNIPHEPQSSIASTKDIIMFEEVSTNEKAPAAAKQDWSSLKSTQQDDNKPEVQCKEIQGTPAAASQLDSQRPTDTQPPVQTSIRSFPEELIPWPDRVNMVEVANDMEQMIRKHCVLTEKEADAVVMWIVSSYVFDGFRVFPKLALISPEKRCGKTTTMEVIHAMCRDGLITANISPAIIYRLTSVYQPTLLIDEADTFVKNGDPALIGLINSGHTKSGAFVMRCEGENYEPKAHSTWMPMVLASIGDLPSTIMDRSIVINLRRKKSTEHVVRLPGNIFERCVEVRQKILRWCIDHEHLIHQDYVEPPMVGNDRAVDNWIPLLSVANQITKEWLERCNQAYKALTITPEPELPTELLRGFKEYFQITREEKVASRTIAEHLASAADRPLAEFGSGKPLSMAGIAQLLKPYGIKPKVMRCGDTAVRGYERSQFIDAFERYL